jgi:anti-sigma factor RsiW
MTDTSCPEILRTQAWLDGELDETAASEAQRHVESCTDCRAFVADTAAVSDAIRRDASRWTAPPNLRTRVTAAVAGESRRTRIDLRSGNFWFGAAGGAGLSALAAALILFLLLPASSTSLVESVTDAHTNALMGHHTIEIVSSSHHTVKPWFAGRIAVSPPVADFAAQGFALAGGRVDHVAGEPAAVVVYRHGAHEIDLFAWADNGRTLPREEVRHGYRTVFWKNGDLDLAAISDMEGAELEKFVKLARSETP